MSQIIKDSSSKKESKGVDKRSKSLRFFSVGSIIAIIAILIVVNVLFETMLGNVLTWDLTSNQNNSIGDITKGLISKLDKDVEIVGLFELTDSTKQQYKDFIPMLTDYANESGGKIQVRYVDPQKFPSILTELDPNKTLSPEAGSFVIKCGDRLRVISPQDCYTVNQEASYATNQVIIQSNSIEMNFTGAVQAVTSDSNYKVYSLTNHGEASTKEIGTLLKNNGFSVQDISTLSIDKIPDDCSLLIMQLPQKDISTTDVDLLTSYLEGGGNLIVVTDYSSGLIALPNLNQVLHTMNLNITDALVNENDMNYRIQATSGYGSYANVVTGTFSQGDVDKAIFAAYCRGINAFDNPKAYISTEPIITTSAKGILEENGDPEQAGVEGVQNIAMYSKSSFGEVPGEVVVFGTSYLTSDSFIEKFSLNDQNVLFFATVVKKMVGIENSVQIPVKEYPSFDLKTLPSANMQTVISVGLIAVLPLAMIGAAIVVYRKRKHL